MSDAEGRPIVVQVYPGNAADPKTVTDQVEKLRQEFRLSRVVLVGDRGMLTQPQIDKIKKHPGLGWITALTSVAIRSLVIQKGVTDASDKDVLQRLKREQGSAPTATEVVSSGSEEAEHLIDEPVLHSDVTLCHPPNLALPNLAHCFRNPESSSAHN